MKRISLTLGTLLLASLLSSGALAQSRGVGLGVAAGVALPDASNISLKTAFNWGFFVDIPLLYTFHITPSTLVYNLKPEGSTASGSATDVSLNFKFIVPLGFLDLFGGILAGLTSSASGLDPHVGVLGGAGIHLVSNLDLFAQLNYKLLLRDSTAGGNIRDLQIFAGPLFRFQ